MPAGFHQYLRLTPEDPGDPFGTYDSEATPFWVPLLGPDMFKMSKVPQREVIKSAHTGNRRALVVSNRHLCQGTLTTFVYQSYAQRIIEWGTKLTSNELGSYTADYFDGTDYWRFLGVKVRQMTITTSSDRPQMVIALDLQGKTTEAIDAEDLAAPADGNFPAATVQPYLHTEAGSLSIGSARAGFRMVNLTVRNNLAAPFDEGSSVSSLTWCGREVDLDIEFQYVSDAMRTAFEGQAGQDAEITYVKSSNSIKFDLHTAGRLGSFDRSLPLDGLTYQNVKVESLFVGSSTDDDLTVTFV